MKKILNVALVVLTAFAAGCAAEAGDTAESTEQGITAGPVRYASSDAHAILDQYAGYSLAQLDAAFAQGGVPTYAELAGVTAGRFLAKNPHNAWWSVPLVNTLFESCFTNWTGKRFDTAFGPGERGTGINLFQNPFVQENYRFDTYLESARADGRGALALDYRGYPGPMSGLVDDVREVRSGVVLGQMYYYFAWQPRPEFVGYFMLVALD